MTWEIIIKGVDGQGDERTRFDRDIVRIGRLREGNDVILRHPSISKQHALLLRQGDEYFIEDPGSRNGVFIKTGLGSVRVKSRLRLELPAEISLSGKVNLLVDVHRQEEMVTLDASGEDDYPDETLIPDLRKLERVESMLVLDLCDATGQANRNEEMAYTLKVRLEQISRPVLERMAARFIKNTGDGFLATFPGAVAAMEAALEIAEKIAQRNARSKNEPIHYRMALHHGTTYPIGIGDEDIHGSDVNIVFRLEGLQGDKAAMIETRSEVPARDRILCSRSFHEQLSEQGSPLINRLRSLGSARFQGIDKPHEVFLAGTTTRE